LLASAPKKPQISLDAHTFLVEILRDKYQEELDRQRKEQTRLEEAMNRQEPQSKRDEQLGELDQWLDKQEKGSGRTKSG
jgi:hypothetical protein